MLRKPYSNITLASFGKSILSEFSHQVQGVAISGNKKSLIATRYLFIINELSVSVADVALI